MNTSTVEVVNLSHRYNVQWAVKDINLKLNKYGIYGLLGANGAGKSTIMNVICGVLKQTHGEVFINGISMAEHPIEAKKHIGFLPQKPPLLMDLTVEEYLAHSAAMRLMPELKIKTAVETVMEKCQVTDFRKRLLRHLSGGYQQRVGIAQSIIHEPSVVVMDEPTNGLDPNQILEVRNLIKTIAQERTVILSTHILQEVQALCESIWMINEGNVVFSGPIGDFDNYIRPNTLTASFLQAPSIPELIQKLDLLYAEEVAPQTYKIQFDNAHDTLEKVIETSVANHWRLIEIYLDKTSLDKVFAALSKKPN